MKLNICLCLLLLLLSCEDTREDMVARIISEKIRSNQLDPTFAQLMSDLGTKYTPKCLWVIIGDARYWGSYWDHSYAILNLTGMESRRAAIYINKNADELTRYSCVTYMMTDFPEQSVLQALADPANKRMTRYFMIRVVDSDVARRLLLDRRLRDEENVAAVLKTLSSSEAITWNIFTRQLLSPTGFPLVKQANRWTKIRGLSYNEELFPEQMANFYGMKLQGVTLDFRPLVDYREIPNSREVIPSSSLDVSILEVIAKTLNFTYELKKPEDGLWGVQGEDGHWNGVVGTVEFRRANFSLVLSVTQERRLSVDFTRVYYTDPLSFVTAKSRPEPAWLKLITPFSDYVWLLAVSTVAIAVVFYYFLFRIQGSLGSLRITGPRAFMHVFGSFLSQSLFTMPWLSAGQVFLGFWFLYSFLVSSYYKTSLTATLAVPSVPPTIDTLVQLLRSNLRYGMIAQKGSEYQLFSTSNVSLYQQLFQRMTFYSSDESMRLVAKGKYAYIYFKSNLQTIVNTEYTSLNGETALHIATEEFFPGGYGWAFPKGAPYRRTFDRVMWRCVQAGLIGKWLNDLNTIYAKEAQDQKTEAQKQKEREASLAKRDDGLVVLNLNHLQGAFLTLLFGYGFGLVVLMLEAGFHRFCLSCGKKKRVSETSLKVDPKFLVKQNMSKGY